MNVSRNYGYIKGKDDPHDVKIRFTENHVVAFSRKKNLQKSGPIFDLRELVVLPKELADMEQGTLGSCTANAIAYAYIFCEVKQGNRDIFMPSRLFIYYNERMIEGTIGMDMGAEIRDGIKSIAKYGVCDEGHWPYDPMKFSVKPSKKIYNLAKNGKALKYARIDFSQEKTIADRVAHLKKSVMSGYPFVFGFTVYPYFESDEMRGSGVLPMPSADEEPVGGHAVCCVGFNDDTKCFIVKNSWGPTWGKEGYFTMPYEYVGDENLADDFWIIQKVTDPENMTNADINASDTGRRSNRGSRGSRRSESEDTRSRKRNSRKIEIDDLPFRRPNRDSKKIETEELRIVLEKMKEDLTEANKTEEAKKIEDALRLIKIETPAENEQCRIL